MEDIEDSISQSLTLMQVCGFPREPTFVRIFEIMEIKLSTMLTTFIKFDL